MTLAELIRDEARQKGATEEAIDLILRTYDLLGECAEAVERDPEAESRAVRAELARKAETR